MSEGPIARSTRVVVGTLVALAILAGVSVAFSAPVVAAYAHTTVRAHHAFADTTIRGAMAIQTITGKSAPHSPRPTLPSSVSDNASTKGGLRGSPVHEPLIGVVLVRITAAHDSHGAPCTYESPRRSTPAYDLSCLPASGSMSTYASLVRPLMGSIYAYDSPTDLSRLDRTLIPASATGTAVGAAMNLGHATSAFSAARLVILTIASRSVAAGHQTREPIPLVVATRGPRAPPCGLLVSTATADAGGDPVNGGDPSGMGWLGPVDEQRQQLNWWDELQWSQGNYLVNQYITGTGPSGSIGSGIGWLPHFFTSILPTFIGTTLPSFFGCAPSAPPYSETFYGPDGCVGYQTSPTTGTVSWGVTMYPGLSGPLGYFDAIISVNGNTVDAKWNQPKWPTLHGSLPTSVAPPGSIVQVMAEYITPLVTYKNVPDDIYIVPNLATSTTSYGTGCGDLVA